VTDSRRFSGEYADDVERRRAAGGPARPEDASADGADLASTDMSQDTGARADAGQAEYLGGQGLPMEPEAEAIRRLEGQLGEERDRHLRLAAEYDNYRKRVARERGELTDRAQATLVGRLLDVLDDMDRLAADRANASVDAIRQAIELLDKKLQKELQAVGLERLDPVGEPFDPSLHEAVSIVPPPTKAQDHQVAATFQPGYRFKGTLVRPARVQVYSDQGQA
jgi:molecular chaperone GrpE